MSSAVSLKAENSSRYIHRVQGQYVFSRFMRGGTADRSWNREEGGESEAIDDWRRGAVQRVEQKRRGNLPPAVATELSLD